MTEDKFNINDVTPVGRTTREIFELHRELQKELYRTGRRIQKEFEGKAVLSRMHVRIPSELYDSQIFSIDRENIPLSEVASRDSLVIVYGDYGLYGRLAGESKATRSGMEWRRIEAMWRFLHDHCGCVMAQEIARECAEELKIGYSHSERYMEAALRRLTKEFGGHLERGDLKDQAPGIIEAFKGYTRENFYFEDEKNIELFNEDAIRQTARNTVLLVAADRGVRDGRKFRITKRLYKITVESDVPEEITLPEPAKEPLLGRAGRRVKGIFLHPFSRRQIDEREYSRVVMALSENLHLLRRDNAIRVLVTPPRLEEVLYYAKALMENDVVSRIYVSPIEETRPSEWSNL